MQPSHKHTPAAIYIPTRPPTASSSPSHDYAEAKHLYELLTQITKVFLRKNALTSQQTIQQFLSQCHKGQYVLLKSYGSFSKSPLCRLCFLHNFLKIFETDATQRNGLDYFQLSRLLCSDFPKQLISKAVALIIECDPATILYQPVPSKPFSQALCFQVLCGDYIEGVSSYFATHPKLSYLEAYRVLQRQDKRITPEMCKPPLGVMVQSLLNVMRWRGAFRRREAEVVFLTEHNTEDFLSGLEEEGVGQDVGLDELLRECLKSSQFRDIIQQRLCLFENSSFWASQQHKILSLRDGSETPLNVRKKGKGR